MNSHTKVISWPEIKATVEKINPELYTILERINPSSDLKLYHVRYPFGMTIVENGIFHLPVSQTESASILDPRMDPSIQQAFEYAEGCLPAGLIFKNNYEMFIEYEDRIIPTIIAPTGSVFSLWKQLDITPSFHPVNLFNITAGARSLFMVPNIGDAMFHKNLKRDFNIHEQPPKNLADQWYTFKSIVDNSHCNWAVELILFPNEWIEKITSDHAWRDLYLHLLEYSWQKSAYERNQLFYNFAISCAQHNRNLKPNPYLLDTAKHLLAITLGSAPGIAPAVDESLAPIELIQRAYVESYGLKKYVPTIMQPKHFDLFNNDAEPVYYSLQFPSTLSFSPRSRKQSSTLFDLRELKHIMQILMEEIAREKIYMEHTIVTKLPECLQFDYFHNKLDQHEEISSTDLMPEDDFNLIYVARPTDHAKFASNGTFVRGCVRIMQKEPL